MPQKNAPVSRLDLGRRAGIAAIFLISMALGVALGPASADVVGRPGAAPTFDSTDAGLLKENPSLAEIVRDNPHLGRLILDRALAAEGDAAARVMLGDDTAPTLTDEEQALVKANPLLERGMRSSPEAALDLLRLIKQAADKKAKYQDN